MENRRFVIPEFTRNIQVLERGVEASFEPDGNCNSLKERLWHCLHRIKRNGRHLAPTEEILNPEGMRIL